jgi:endonuclease/exonuclease/phosphatase family metal-dependent hydrolase
VIARFIETLPPEVPVVLVGDFNDPAGQEVHQNLTGILPDAWLEAANKSGPEGTFHGFRGEVGERRIDWILLRAPWAVLEAESVTYNESGRYPSDHLPIFALFSVGPTSQ